MNIDLEPRDDEYVMPCAEAMLAGTLALLTGHAECDCPSQRELMARKVRSNLFFLAQHPGLSPEFRTVAQRMHGHWDRMIEPRQAAAWHAPAALVQ